MSNLLYLNVVGKGAPVVLLHGWGWHSDIWTSLVPHLADKYQLFMPDLPGFGKSADFTRHYNFDEIASSLFEIIPEKAIWLGWSLGGMIAWWIAIHYPEKVTQLITIASSPKFIDEANWPGVSQTTLDRFSTQLLHQYEKTLDEFLLLQLRGSSKNQTVMTELKAQRAPIAMSALMGGLKLLSETDLRSDLSQIKIPSLHIFGGMDTLVPANVISHLQSLIAHGHCALIKRAGHIPFLSHQDEFLQLLLSRLDE